MSTPGITLKRENIVRGSSIFAFFPRLTPSGLGVGLRRAGNGMPVGTGSQVLSAENLPGAPITTSAAPHPGEAGEDPSNDPIGTKI